ncbi:3-deoxy-D-manno-octulosonic acid kinase [hydrothermal vent metagenome]|uniref:3-deoxy-D-manno-octulosonic acid kinase n=1 Tax=hydrothermal vent metagenome TaxID=652676 RepID=A0A3B0XLM4_9ZZZZ
MQHYDGSSVVHAKGCHLLYNADLLAQPDPCLLKEGIFQQASSYQKITAGGRGQAWFLEMAGLSAVLRSYQRGGLVAKLNRQSYFGFQLENSRAFKEWRLLQWMFERGLPVPQPVAASISRWPFAFSPLYRAHILLLRLENTQTLDQLLGLQQPNDNLWRLVGQCIRQFHNAGVFHADLNANNILIDDQLRVYLIDFDKSFVRTGALTQVLKQQNLARLKRSLLKQQGLAEKYFFTEGNWKVLLEGYEPEKIS